MRQDSATIRNVGNGAIVPPWLWILLAWYLVAFLYLRDEIDRYILDNQPDPWLLMLVLLIPVLILLGGFITLLTPWIRAAYLEWRFSLGEPPPSAPTMREISGFIHEHAPDLRVKSNLLRTDQFAFVYPLGYSRMAVAIFAGLIKLWRSDRQEAKAVILHEIGHYRHGDALVIGQGSLFSAFLRYGVWLSSLILFADVVILDVMELRSEGATVETLAALPTILTVTVGVAWDTGQFLIFELLILVVTLILPLTGIWCAEFAADRFAVEAQGSSDALAKILERVRHRVSWWRWILFRLSHPPDRARRLAVLHAKETAGVVALLLLFPMAVLIFMLAFALLRWGFPVMRGNTSAYMYEFKLYLDRLTPYWLSMTVIILIWPVMAGYWERLFYRPFQAKEIPNWSSYRGYVITTLIMAGMASLYYAAVPRSTGIPEPGPLPAGEYSTNFFDPGLSFRVGESWEVWSSAEGYGKFGIRSKELVMTFQNPAGIVRPEEVDLNLQRPIQREGNELTLNTVRDVPDDLVGWFQEHPNLYTSHPVPVTIGGARGVQFDTGVSSKPKNYPRRSCPVPCIGIFYSLSGNWSVIYENETNRIVVLNVEGETVVIEIKSPRDKVRELMPEAKQVLATVKWDGVSTSERFEMPDPQLLMVPQRGSLPAGRYLTDEFDPAYHFSVGEGWNVVHQESNYRLAFAQPEKAALYFDNVRKVYDPQQPDFEHVLTKPHDMVSWLRKHPHLDAEKPIPVTVGGITGRQLDVEVSSTPRDNPQYCGSTPCVPLWPILGVEPAQWLSLYPGYETRMIILEVKGETIIISIGTRSRNLSETPSQVATILDTVKWRDEVQASE